MLARRLELLVSISESLPTSALTRAVDVTNGEKAEQILRDLIKEMGGVDLIILSSGVGFPNPNLDWEKEAETAQDGQGEAEEGEAEESWRRRFF